jgi:hypothetical protein
MLPSRVTEEACSSRRRWSHRMVKEALWAGQRQQLLNGGSEADCEGHRVLTLIARWTSVCLLETAELRVSKRPRSRDAPPTSGRGCEAAQVTLSSCATVDDARVMLFRSSYQSVQRQ